MHYVADGVWVNYKLTYHNNRCNITLQNKKYQNVVKSGKDTNKENVTQLWNKIVHNEKNIPKLYRIKQSEKMRKVYKYVNKRCDTGDCVIFTVSVKRIKYHSLNREMLLLSKETVLCLLQNENVFLILLVILLFSAITNGAPQKSTSLTFRGIPLGALSDTHQLQIFPTRTIRGDIIACQLQGCTTGTDCRDFSKFHLANRCHYWWYY